MLFQGHPAVINNNNSRKTNLDVTCKKEKAGLCVVYEETIVLGPSAVLRISLTMVCTYERKTLIQEWRQQ